MGDDICHRRSSRKARHKDGNVFIGIEAFRLDSAEAEGAVGSRHEAVDVRDGGPVLEKRLQTTAKEQRARRIQVPQTTDLKILVVEFLPRADLEACQSGLEASLASEAHATRSCVHVHKHV